MPRSSKPVSTAAKAARRRIYLPGSRGQRLNRRAAWISGVLAVATVVLTWFALANPAHPCVRYFPLLVLGWAVGPPLWFWFEYYFVYLAEGAPGSEEWFKHGQQVSFAIWAGIALSLGGIASSDRFDAATKSDRSCSVIEDKQKTRPHR